MTRWAALPVLALVSLGACSSTDVSPAVVRHFTGVPSTVTTAEVQAHLLSVKPWATWAGPASIDVITLGSGSCPRLPASVRAASGNRVIVKTVEHETGDACTSDLRPVTSVVRMPAGIDTARAVVVIIDGTVTRLAARPR